MEGNTFHTTMAKQSSAITQPVGLSARGRMACMATGYVVGVGGSWQFCQPQGAPRMGDFRRNFGYRGVNSGEFTMR